MEKLILPLGHHHIPEGTWVPKYWGSSCSPSDAPSGVLGPLHLAWHTWRCPCISIVMEATHEGSQGSKTQTRELLQGTTENSVFPMKDHWFITKRKQKKIELVARPEVDSLRASETADLPAAISNYPLHLKQEERSSVCFNATWKHSTIKINGSMF